MCGRKYSTHHSTADVYACMLLMLPSRSGTHAVLAAETLCCRDLQFICTHAITMLGCLPHPNCTEQAGSCVSGQTAEVLQKSSELFDSAEHEQRLRGQCCSLDNSSADSCLTATAEGSPSSSCCSHSCSSWSSSSLAAAQNIQSA